MKLPSNPPDCIHLPSFLRFSGILRDSPGFSGILRDSPGFSGDFFEDPIQSRLGSGYDWRCLNFEEEVGEKGAREGDGRCGHGGAGNGNFISV